MHIILFAVLLLAPRHGIVNHGAVPCYTLNGGPCGSTYHEDHDHITLATSGDCTIDSFCTLAPSISFPLGGQFLNTNYTCYGNTQGLSETLLFAAISTSQVGVGFYNQSGAEIYSGTQITVAFTCEGT